MLLGPTKAAGLVVAVSLLNLWLDSSGGISVEEFVTLSLEQKAFLNQFKQRVISKVPHDYMKNELYLIRWLREYNFDVGLAEKKLMNNLRWREENQMDSIIKEDWKDLSRDHKWAVEGCDREGKLIASIYLGDWDLRKQILTGRGDRLRRYTQLIAEEATILVRNMLAAGENSTQSWIIIELKNFNLLQHGCPNCISIYLNLLNVYFERYPGYVHKLVLVNTPQYAHTVLELIKPYMSETLKRFLHIYGTDKRLWQKELFREIDPTQLTHNFGGLKDEPTDLDDLRKNGYRYRCSGQHSQKPRVQPQVREGRANKLRNTTTTTIMPGSEEEAEGFTDKPISRKVYQVYRVASAGGNLNEPSQSMSLLAIFLFIFFITM